VTRHLYAPEVFEETGVRASGEGAGVLCFWHRHGLTWGKSDLYVVCRLEVRSMASHGFL